MYKIQQADVHNEKFQQEYSTVKTKCPNCGVSAKIRKAFKFQGKESQRYIEISNSYGICNSCQEYFRISNGYIYKSSKPEGYCFTVSEFKQIKVLFICLILLVFLGLLFWFLSYYIYIFLFVLFALGITFIFLALQHYYNFLLVLEESQDTDNDIGEILLGEQAMGHAEQIVQQNDIIEALGGGLLVDYSSYGTFPNEKALQHYLWQNLSNIRFNQKKILPYQTEKSNGLEYYTPIGRIDILCLDEDDNFVVIETKYHRVPDKTIGQISRYMGWVQKNLVVNDDQKVYGLIVGKTITSKLKYATVNQPNIYLFEYGSCLRLSHIEV